MNNKEFEKLYNADLQRLEAEVAKEWAAKEISVRGVIEGCKHLARQGFTAFARQDVMNRIINAMLGIYCPELENATKINY